MSQAPGDSLAQWTIRRDNTYWYVTSSKALVGPSCLAAPKSIDVRKLMTADASSSVTSVRLDYAFQVSDTAGAEMAGLAFGVQDADTYYEALSVSGSDHQRLQVNVVENGSRTELSNTGTAVGVGGTRSWHDVRFDVWDSSNGVTVRLAAGDRGSTPFTGLSEVNTFTITGSDFIGGSFTPGQVGIAARQSIKDTGINLGYPMWFDDIRVYWD